MQFSSISPIGNRLSSRPAMPSYLEIVSYYSGILAARGMPSEVRWIFREDWARTRRGDDTRYYAFNPRSADRGEAIVVQAFQRLRFHRPLAVVAYGATDRFVLTGLQADMFESDDDLYRKDWDMFFDTKNNMNPAPLVVTNALDWNTIRATQPTWLSELDFAVSVNWIQGTN